MKYFLDTNVILEFFIENRKNHKNIRLLLQEISNRDIETEIWIDRDSISTIDYLLRKSENRHAIIESIIHNFKIANDISCLKESFDFSVKHNADYEDIVKVMTADRIESVVFLTADKKLLSLSKHFDIKIIAIEQMLKKFGYSKNSFDEFEKPKTKVQLKKEELISVISIRKIQGVIKVDSVENFVNGLSETEIEEMLNEPENQKILNLIKSGIVPIAPS